MDRLRVQEGKDFLTAAEYNMLVEEYKNPVRKANPMKKKTLVIVPERLKNDLTVIEINYQIKVKYYFDLIPVPAPRMTSSDRWLTGDRQRPKVKRYFQYCNALRLFCNSMQVELTEVLNIAFIVPIPESWTKKKKESMLFKYHNQKPDRDNLLKAYQDSFSNDDGYVADGRTFKIWGNRGGIIIF